VIYHFAYTLHDASGEESRSVDAEVDKTDQPKSAEKPPQLTHFLQEPKKDGPFTSLRVNQPSGDADTAFVGSWAGKDGKVV
jgi:hypothetical protein